MPIMSKQSAGFWGYNHKQDIVLTLKFIASQKLWEINIFKSE